MSYSDSYLNLNRPEVGPENFVGKSLSRLLVTDIQNTMEITSYFISTVVVEVFKNNLLEIQF